MPIFMSYDGIDGDVTTEAGKTTPAVLMQACASGQHSEPTPADSFFFGDDTSAKGTSPSTSEIVVVKIMDATSPLLFDDSAPADSFADDNGESASGHSGGVNVCLGDGSVHTSDPNYNPYVTVDYVADLG